MNLSLTSPRPRGLPKARLLAAVARSSRLSPTGLLERLFARAFMGLVYPQIWEDPEVDLAALRIAPGQRIVTIASGGCNALSYLIADPARIEAVDLNPAHVAFNRLKLTALVGLPDYEAFHRFYARAGERTNPDAYDRHIRPLLDPESRAYWEQRTLSGRRRISVFGRNLYRRGLLGLFIGSAHAAARLYGVDPRDLLKAATIEEQRRYFNSALAPLFDKRLIRWAISFRASLFGLGIPPQQYEALAGAGNGDVVHVLRGRLEKLACGFPVSDNYFAWQAFGRGYSTAADASLPPYLSRANFETIRARAGRVLVVNTSFTEHLKAKRPGSVDRFVLLDAQDWMTTAQVNELWQEITRTAAPGARVIFRTAAEKSILSGRVDDALLKRWSYRHVESQVLHTRDRSSIYGGFHLYVLRDQAE